MAFSNERHPFSDKNMLIKTIQNLNQHLPARRQNLSELLVEERPGIKGKDNTFYVMDKCELDLISRSVPRFMWSRLRLPLLIEMSPDFGSGAARVQGEAEVELVTKLLNLKRTWEKSLVIYLPDVRELRRKLPTTTQYAFVTSIRESHDEE